MTTTTDPTMAGDEVRGGVVDPHFIRRHGAFFRPNAAGYCNDIAGAGIYSGEEARHYLSRDVEGLSIHPVAYYAAEIDLVLAGAERLRAALYPAAAQDAEGVLREVAAERRRQTEGEGWTQAHDDTHYFGEMASAAAAYAFHATVSDRARVATRNPPTLWPWHPHWWKPKSRRHDLIRAAALIVAEIERLDRSALAGAGEREKNG